MSAFEYLAVLISIIIGLGVTQLLAGIGQAIHQRSSNRVDVLHIVWTANVFMVLVLNWWVAFSWRNEATWSFETFLFVVLWAVSMFMLAVLLYPPRLDPGEDYADVFEKNRIWFLGTFIIMIGADIGQTALRGGLLNPPIYLPFVLHYAVLFAIGIAVPNPRYQNFLAWWVLVTILIWSFVVRRMLA